MQNPNARMRFLRRLSLKQWTIVTAFVLMGMVAPLLVSSAYAQCESGVLQTAPTPVVVYEQQVIPQQLPPPNYCQEEIVVATPVIYTTDMGQAPGYCDPYVKPQPTPATCCIELDQPCCCEETGSEAAVHPPTVRVSQSVCFKSPNMCCRPSGKSLVPTTQRLAEMDKGDDTTYGCCPSRDWDTYDYPYYSGTVPAVPDVWYQQP